MIKHLSGFLVLIMLLATPAFACDVLEKTSPRQGAVVSKSLKEISLTFSGPVAKEGSSVELFDAKGEPICTGDVHVSAKNSKVLVLPVHDLAPGKYKMVWNASLDCGCEIPGESTFTVK